MEDILPPIVIYHANCIDGLASAWAVARRYGDEHGEKLTYIPYGHHDREESEDKIRAALSEGRRVYFVDVAPTPEFLDELALDPRGLQIRIIDHHKGAAESLNDRLPAANVHIHIDADHPSASGMVWNEMLPQEKPPVFLHMIEKMDVVQDLRDDAENAAAALIDSKDISSVKAAFNSFSEMAPFTLGDMVLMGHEILADQTSRMEKLRSCILYAQLSLEEGAAPVWVPVVNADVRNYGRNISTFLVGLAHENGVGVACAWYVQGNGSVSVSLRTNGAPDANALAKHMSKTMNIDGGGHATSACVHFGSVAEFYGRMPLYTLEQTRLLQKKPAALKP